MLCDAFVAHQHKTQIIHHRNGIYRLLGSNPLNQFSPCNLIYNLKTKHKITNSLVALKAERDRERKDERGWMAREQEIRGK